MLHLDENFEHAEDLNEIASLLNEMITSVEEMSLWDELRDSVNSKFEIAKSNLEQQDYKICLGLFTECNATYSEYSAYLSQSEQKNYDLLPDILEQAVRGATRSRNMRIQAQINVHRTSLRKEIHSYNMEASLNILKKISSLNKKITNVSDVTHMGFITDEQIKDSEFAINKFNRSYDNRYEIDSKACAEKTLTKVTLTHKISAESKMALINLVQIVLKEVWFNLDRRSLDNLSDGMAGVIKDNLRARSCIFSCWYSTTHNVPELFLLRIIILGYVEKHLPNEPCEDIQLPVLIDSHSILPKRSVSFTKDVTFIDKKLGHSYTPIPKTDAQELRSALMSAFTIR